MCEKGVPNGSSGCSVPAPNLVFPSHSLTMWLGANCRILSFQQSLCMSVEFHGDHKTIIKLRWIWPPSVYGDITGFKTVVSVCMRVRSCGCTIDTSTNRISRRQRVKVELVSLSPQGYVNVLRLLSKDSKYSTSDQSIRLNLQCQQYHAKFINNATDIGTQCGKQYRTIFRK